VSDTAPPPPSPAPGGAEAASSPGGARAAPESFARALLAWYDRHRRDLPWRAAAGSPPADPYRVWLSEIMLQQTTVPAAKGYYAAFLDRWPTVADLAAAELDDVLHAWQGLGYYARARNLHRTARAVAAHGGRFPETEAQLLALPGIGAYTAAAVAAIAFGRKATVVDANVERVIARLFQVEEPLPAARRPIRDHAAALTPERRPGDYAQAMMDLGALVCTPRAPRCMLCPVAGWCRGRAAGIAELLPARRTKAAKPLRHGVAFWAVRPDGAVLLRRRPDRGLLGGLMEVPSTDWRAQPWAAAEARRAAPVPAAWKPLAGSVRHGFTHFDLELAVMTARVPAGAPVEGVWSAPERLHEHALPTLMKKVARHAQAKLEARG